jgi:trans-2,3-dihydro-3-hydroxyanthranilate isomerase
VRTLRYNVCDVFTDRPLTGNPLAVFTDARGLDAPTMQALARELNLSETVFALPPGQGGHARIRIFTPASEIPFAGHPVLGTAVLLGGPMQLTSIRLETGVGVIPVRFEREGPRIRFAWMTQPVPTVAPFEQAGALLAALGVAASVLPVELYDNGLRHAYVTLASREEVAALRPDLGRLAALPPIGFNVIAGDGRAWKTRMFAPHHGIPEDPATGSAAGPLAVHLLRHGRIAGGEEIVIEQGAEIARPSRLHARVTGAAARIEAVEVGGSALVVARGELQIP